LAEACERSAERAAEKSTAAGHKEGRTIPISLKQIGGGCTCWAATWDVRVLLRRRLPTQKIGARRLAPIAVRYDSPIMME
jgi:hypothetical protein